jgi:hypothetical protein
MVVEHRANVARATEVLELSNGRGVGARATQIAGDVTDESQRPCLVPEAKCRLKGDHR